ncbi:hypothetical protein FB451DRAFT_1450431 [Mycena latifolia]|nr:hypothetical protein FB451DRAFT_1450431 [Mycena latifolia]
MRRHNPVRVPNSHLPKGLASASKTSSKMDAILPIIQKMEGTDATKRKWACVAVSNLIQNDPLTCRLLQGKNIVGVLITRLTDSEEEVVIEAMWALRNLCIDGGYICAEMYNKSILLLTTLSQDLNGPKNAPDNTQKLVYEFSDNVITVLWCLSKTSNKALTAINKMKLIPFLMSFLAARDKIPLRPVTAAAQCLYVLTDDNYPPVVPLGCARTQRCTWPPTDTLLRAHALLEVTFTHYFPDARDPDDLSVCKMVKSESGGAGGADLLDDKLALLLVLITRLCIADEPSRTQMCATSPHSTATSIKAQPVFTFAVRPFPPPDPQRDEGPSSPRSPPGQAQTPPPGTPPSPPPSRQAPTHSSDSSSNYSSDTSFFSSPITSMSSTTTNKHATVSRHTGKLPTFHRGEITALACSEFQDACTNYFAHKDTAAEKQVSIILGCFEDMKVNNWTRPVAQRKRLTALSFPDFMGEFRKKFLKANWMEATHAEVLSSRMKAVETFDEWATNLQSLSALLSDEASANAVKLDDKRLRHTLEAGMLPDLSHRYYLHPTVSKISDNKFDEWLHAVIEIDEAHQYEDDRIAAALHAADRGKCKAPGPTDDAEHAPKKVFNDSRKGNVASKPSSSSSTADSAAFCPPLTNDERELLRNNDGCNKCRRFFVGHKSPDCPNGFPDPSTYKVLTQAEADHQKAAKKGKSVAVVMPGIDNDNDSDDDSENADVSSNSFPYHIPHLHWDCLVEGPMSNLPLPITVLIDDGAHLVLIDSDLVDKLALRRFTLHKPEPISLAIANNGAPLTHLTQYIKLSLLSRDQSWSSRSVRVLIAPNLCAPVILGLPWLVRNTIVVDHAARSAIDKICGYDILNPPPPPPAPKKIVKLREKIKRTKADLKSMARELHSVCEKRKLEMEANNLFETVKPVDVVAAVRERIEVLAHWDELLKRGDNIRQEYPTLFEPMPHVDMLLTNVLCEIKVKDADRNLETHSYQSPCKYKEAWQTLIQAHLDAGRIRPSTSPHASPAFLVPKSDKLVLPQWVNNF